MIKIKFSKKVFLVAGLVILSAGCVFTAIQLTSAVTPNPGHSYLDIELPADGAVWSGLNTDKVDSIDIFDADNIIKEELLPYCSEEITSDVYDNGENQATGCVFGGYDGYYDISNLIPENVKIGLSFGRGETGTLAPTGSGNCYTNADGDAYYNMFPISVSEAVCTSLDGTTSYDLSTCSDCDDADPEVYPGHSGLSFADGKDNDCNSQIDECLSGYYADIYYYRFVWCNDGYGSGHIGGKQCGSCPSESLDYVCSDHDGVSSYECHSTGQCDYICTGGWN